LIHGLVVAVGTAVCVVNTDCSFIRQDLQNDRVSGLITAA